jgi:heptosyltransferase-2
MPGSAWPSKTWPAEHYRALLLRARSEGFTVAVLGAPDEAAICAAVAGAEGLDLCGKTTLKEAAAWMRHATAVVGNDSGLSHLAAACGTATLALYGATDPGGSAPWGPRSRTLRQEGIPCAPCFKRTCDIPGHPCLNGLSPDQVWTELQVLLDPSRAQSQ